MNVYVRVEVLAREFQGRLLLALVAAERGHEVLIGKHNESSVVGNGLKSGYPPGIFHDKSLGVNDTKSVVKEHLYLQGWGLTAQDEEHGLSASSFATPEMISRFPSDGFSRNHLLFSWGEHDHAAIQGLLPGEKDHIVLTGSPRVDFWRPEFRDVHDTSEIRDVTGGVPFILFAPAGPPTADSVNPGAPRNRPRRGEGEVEAARHIAQQNPSTLIVVRPHPSQFLDSWQADFEGSPPNILVFRDQRASVWVRHAEAVISNGSTLAMEACVMGVPHINFAPSGDYVFGSRDGGFAHQLGPACTDSEALADELARARDLTLASDWYTEEALRGIAARFSSLSGPLAADRIVDEWEVLADRLRLADSPKVAAHIENIFSKRAPNQSDSAWARSSDRVSRFRREFSHRRAFGNAQRTSSGGRHPKAPFMEKFPPFDVVAVDRMLRRLREVTGRFANVRRQVVHDRMLLFTRD